MEYDGTDRYTYNSDGSLASVDNGEFVPSYMYNAAVYSYKYDALGRRVLKESDSGDSVLYLYDASDRCIAEYTSADDCATLAYSAGYIYADADGLGAPVAVESAGGSYQYVATDPQGNVIYQTPSCSHIVLVKYDAYGNIYNTSAGDLNLPFRFAGMRYEKDADIYLTPNRAYSPALGRWLQVDPLGTLPNPKQGNRFAPLDQYTDGQNLYEYCSGDPVNSADMLGLVWDPYGGAGGGYTDWTPTDGDINNESDFFDAFVIHWIYGMGATFTQGANVVKAQKDLKTGTSSLLMKLANIYCDELKATGKLRTNGNVIEEGKSWARVSDNWYMRATLNGPSLSYRVRGTYSAENKCSLCKVTFNLQYTWLDRGDLNYHNLSDLLLEIVTLRKLNPAHWFGLAYQDFPININWSDTAVIGHTKSGGSWEILKGWPVEGFYGDYK